MHVVDLHVTRFQKTVLRFIFVSKHKNIRTVYVFTYFGDMLWFITHLEWIWAHIMGRHVRISSPIDTVRFMRRLSLE